MGPARWIYWGWDWPLRTKARMASKLSALMTCSMRQASSAATTGSTPRAVSQAERELPVLTREDWEQLEALGEHLGYLDVDMQERTLLLYLEQLEMSIGALQNRKGETCRLCAGLSLAGGLFLVIIMC